MTTTPDPGVTTPPTDSGNGGLRDRRLAALAYWLSDAYDPELTYDTDGNVLVSDSWYGDADVLLKMLDGIK